MRQQYAGTIYEKFFKGLLCCPYGKCLQNPHSIKPRIIHVDNAHDYLMKKSKLIHSFKMFDDSHVVFYNYNQFNQYSLIHVGLQVVEAARKFMQDYISALNIDIPYCQIDSLLLRKSDYEKIKNKIPLSDKMGDFKIEYEAKKAYILGKGSYLLYNNENDFKVRLIGKTKDFINSINAENYFKSKF